MPSKPNYGKIHSGGDTLDSRYDDGFKDGLETAKQDFCARLEGLKSEGDSLVKDVRNDTLNQAIQAIKE